MADQEKQQLLEALEEKQRLREEKAQQQEKMLQQLKARAIFTAEQIDTRLTLELETFQAMEEKMLVGSQVMEKAMQQLSRRDLQGVDSLPGMRWQTGNCSDQLKARGRSKEGRYGGGRKEAAGATHAAASRMNDAHLSQRPR